MNTEKKLQNAIIRTCGRDPRIRLWRNNVGVVLAPQEIARAIAFLQMGGATSALNVLTSGRKISFSVPGAADLTGIINDGRRLEIEVKSPTGRQSEKQKQYQNLIETMGGVYVLTRSVAATQKAIDRICMDAE